MRLSKIITVFYLPLFSLAAANYSYKTILTDITTITTHLTTLSKTVATITPSIPGLPFALQVQSDGVTLDNTLLSAIDHLSASPSFGAEGSLQIGLALINLQPKISSTLEQIRDKNTTFGELGVVVRASLLQLKRDTERFADELLPKLDELEAGVAPGIVKGIEEAFGEAIQAYS